MSSPSGSDPYVPHQGESNPYAPNPYGQNPYGQSPYAPSATPYAPSADQPTVPGVVFNGAGPGLQGPPRRTRWWILPLVGLGVTLLAGLVPLLRVLEGADELAASVASLEPASQTYSITDRPGWDPLLEHGQQLSDTYRARVDDGTIFEIVPQTQEGLNYVHDVLLLLADENGALRFATDTSDDPAELDAMIQERRARLDELERMFLAGEDFGVDISITGSDGTTYTSDGNNHWDDATP